MAKFMRLLQNENMKIYKRLRTWIMVAIIAAIPILATLVLYAAGVESDANGGWEIIQIESVILYIFITIFAVVVAGETVAGEFTWGTIKLLLIRPHNRSVILLSKFLAVLLFAVLLFVLAFVVTLLINFALFGYTAGNNSLNPDLSNWSYILQFYGLQFISLLVMLSLGFMLSSAFRSAALAIGLAVGMLFASNILVAILMLINKPWTKYLPFQHLNLTDHIGNRSLTIAGDEISLGFSLAVLAGYFIVFNVVSWLVFSRRDVAA